jgi:ornithine decarboxylase
MVKKFKLEEIHTRIISKATLFKVFNFLDKKKLETPFLLIDSEKVKGKLSLIGSNIDQSKVFYAVKANPDPKVIKFLSKLNKGFEIASEGELKIFSKIGIKPDRIITSNPVKSIKFLKMAYAYGIKYFSFDSIDEIEKIAQFAPRSKVYIRLSVPNEGSEWPLSKKFGVELDDAIELLSYANNKGLNPIGITFHVGSQCTNLYNWNIALDKAKILWDMSYRKGIKLRILNIGGGYPINYTKSVIEINTIEKNIDKLIWDKFPKNTEIHIEPGRAVIGDAGILVSKIIGKAKRLDNYWLYIDIGVFNGLMESLGGIKYTYIVESYNQTKKNWTLAGPSCDSFDVIDKNVNLFEPEIGNLFLILSGGAYTISYASEFNGFSIPKTILI